MIQLFSMSIECNVYIPQTVFLSDVGKNHAGHLVPTFKVSCTIVAIILFHDTLEFVSRKQTQKLGKDVLTTRHISSSTLVEYG